MADTNKSFLLAGFERITAGWVNRFSIAAIPPLRRGKTQLESFQRNRDVFVLVMLVLSLAAVSFFPSNRDDLSQYARRAMAAFAAYRSLDVFVTLARTGVFLNFRGDVAIREEPLWRKQRILLGVMLNYIELNMWFSVIYRQISLTSSCEFAEPILNMTQAFNLSFSTMTTIGYGKFTPVGFVSNGFAYFQVLIGVVLLVLVVGSVLALLTSDLPKTSGAPQREAAAAAPNASLSGWFLPASSFLICCVALFYFFGIELCAPDSGSPRNPLSSQETGDPSR